MRFAFCGLLLFGLAALAQQPNPAGPPAGSTPPTFPQGQTPKQSSAPDAGTQASHAMSTPQVQQHIRDKIGSDSSLNNTNVTANANDESVMLAGTVDTERQHQAVLHIAQTYSGSRQILDRIEVKKKP